MKKLWTSALIRLLVVGFIALVLLLLSYPDIYSTKGQSFIFSALFLGAVVGFADRIVVDKLRHLARLEHTRALTDIELAQINWNSRAVKLIIGGRNIDEYFNDRL